MKPRVPNSIATHKPGTAVSSHTAGLTDRFIVPAVCVLLAAIVWFVFGQTLHHAFVNYDDGSYVYENPIVQKGLTWEGFRWAFTHVAASNWHPLTWLSHMLDCELYGLNPAGHHLTNVLLHAAAVILLFLVLRRMTCLRAETAATQTSALWHAGSADIPVRDFQDAAATQAGALWRSAFVAAVFAIHPLRVESVAWVAERKDVLSGVFFMLTLWAYAAYVRAKEDRQRDDKTTDDGTTGKSRERRTKSGEQRTEDGGQGSEVRSPWSVVRSPWSVVSPTSSLFYFLSLCCFALGLMCKPMLVTLPLVLVLLDYWPLRRFSLSAPATPLSPLRSPIPWRLLREKVPFLALAAASCAVTIFAQQPALQSLESTTLPERLGNAALAYVAYLGQMFWPARLAVLYPLPAGGVSLLTTLLSLTLLAGVSTWIFARQRRQPFLLTGWLWYLIMLLPVIGLIQVGSQARADRYTYLPQIGLYLLLTWAAADWCAGWRHRRALLGAGAAAILAALMVSARAQAAHWRNAETLWTHTLACTTDNWLAHINLGDDLLKMGRPADAMRQFQAALQIHPNSAQAHNNLGSILAQRNEADEAVAHFQKALQIQPANWLAHGNLARVLFYQLGRADEAMAQCQQALEIRPGFAQAHLTLGDILLQKGQDAGALTHYQKALQIEPDSPAILNDMSWILATSPDANLRNGEQAVRYAKRACELTKDNDPACVNGEAAAYAEAGRFDEAVAAAQRACALASQGRQLDVLEETRKELALYLTHQPYHRPPGGAPPAVHR